MLDSLKLCLNSHFKRSRKFLANLNFSSKCRTCSRKRRNAKKQKLASDLSCLTSSFPDMEMSTQLKQVFEFIDSNGDGKISSLELKQFLLNLGQEKALATEEAEGMVREMDCNGDGLVDFKEFMNVMEIKESTNGICIESDFMEAFRVFDTDNNGLISAKELKRVLGRLGFENCSINYCRKMIKGVDRDGDGFVNFEDFRCMMSVGY